MHAEDTDLPAGDKVGGFESHHTERGGFNAGFAKMPAGMDTTPLFADLPEGSCQARHWGRVSQYLPYRCGTMAT